MRMKFIGITGGVGAGKSSILQYISAHTLCRIYLADDVAHELELPGEKVYEELVSLLGPEILSPDTRKIDRGRMAMRIFQDAPLLEKVNAIVHPAVREYLLLKKQEAEADGRTELFFVEAALLIECGYKELVDEMWYVYADEETRIHRLMESRGYSIEKARSILASQLSDRAFREGSDFVIDNSGTLAESYAQIRRKLEAFTWLE